MPYLHFVLNIRTSCLAALRAGGRDSLASLAGPRPYRRSNLVHALAPTAAWILLRTCGVKCLLVAHLLRVIARHVPAAAFPVI